MSCHQCGSSFTVSDSTFPGFDLLHCSNPECGRPIKLILKGAPRPSSRPARRGDLNRALRAARRFQQRKGGLT